MSFECRNVQRIVPPTFGATDDHDVFKDIHLTQGERRCMSVQAACEERPSVTSRLGCLFLVWGLLGTAGSANTCRSHRDIVSEPARRTGQAQLIVGGEASHGQTERMYRPALLEKRTGSKDLPHGAFLTVSKARA